MKRCLIVALVCVNVVLLAALVTVNLASASAQTVRGGNDYIMMSAKIEQTFDAIYVLDLNTRRLAAWRFDRTAKRLRPYKGRPLTTDFARK